MSRKAATQPRRSTGFSFSFDQSSGASGWRLRPRRFASARTVFHRGWLNNGLTIKYFRPGRRRPGGCATGGAIGMFGRSQPSSPSSAATCGRERSRGSYRPGIARYGGTQRASDGPIAAQNQRKSGKSATARQMIQVALTLERCAPRSKSLVQSGGPVAAWPFTWPLTVLWIGEMVRPSC